MKIRYGLWKSVGSGKKWKDLNLRLTTQSQNFSISVIDINNKKPTNAWLTISNKKNVR